MHWSFENIVIHNEYEYIALYDIYYYVINYIGEKNEQKYFLQSGRRRWPLTRWVLCPFFNTFLKVWRDSQCLLQILELSFVLFSSSLKMSRKLRTIIYSIEKIFNICNIISSLYNENGFMTNIHLISDSMIHDRQWIKISFNSIILNYFRYFFPWYNFMNSIASRKLVVIYCAAVNTIITIAIIKTENNLTSINNTKSNWDMCAIKTFSYIIINLCVVICLILTSYSSYKC